jgi:prolyl 4-hydroxylase
MTSIPTVWINWIKDSHNRGCCCERTRDILCEQNFDPARIDAVVNAVWNNQPIPKEEPFVDSYIDTLITKHRHVDITILHTGPTVARFDNLLTPAQCNSIMQLGKDLQRAKVVGRKQAEVSEWRTNDLQSLQYNQSPDTVYLEKIIAEITNIPVENGERFQLLHYSPGQYYRPHNDWFHLDNSATNMSLRGQRIATCVVYLNTVERGGHTRFSNLDINVYPQAGSAVYFEYTNKQGRTTDQCLHSSEPVVEGEKWVLTKWLRQRSQMNEQDKSNYD